MPVGTELVLTYIDGYRYVPVKLSEPGWHKLTQISMRQNTGFRLVLNDITRHLGGMEILARYPVGMSTVRHVPCLVVVVIKIPD